MKKIIFGLCFLMFCFVTFSYAQQQTITDYTDSFIKKLENLEMDSYKNMKHWRKGDYEPYQFIRCDVEGGRARLSYQKETTTGQRAFFLVYFTKIDNEWSFDFNDVVFLPKTQYDGNPTALKDAIKTRNKMYWFESDMLE